jgi:hypothetical protein
MATTSNTSGIASFDLGVIDNEDTSDVLTVEVTATDGPNTSLIATADTTVTTSQTISINDVTLNEGNPAQGAPGITNFVFNVTLSSTSTSEVSVSYTVDAGTTEAGELGTVTDSDGGTPGTLSIEAGQTTGTITVPVTGDTEIEGNETFTVNLAILTGDAVLGTPSTGTGTITNDDEAGSLVVTIVGESTSGDGFTSLREAITFANNDGIDSAITFSETAFAAPRKTITLGGMELPNIITTSALSITAPLAGVEISGDGKSRVFVIGNDTHQIAPVTLTGLTITGGQTSGPGGGILKAYGGILTVEGCTLSGNTASEGGAIFMSGLLSMGSTIRNSTLSGNTATTIGAGLYNFYG